MFLRQINLRKEGREYTYLKVVENTWEGGRTQQKTLVNFGNVGGWPKERLEEVVNLLTKFLASDMVLFSRITLDRCRQLGPYLPLSALWDRVGLDEIIEKALVARKADDRVTQCAKAIVLTRLVSPCSKRALSESLSRDIEIPGVSSDVLPLQSYYRTLEYLADAKSEIEKGVHARLAHLFNQDVSLVFYDLTSSYFEGKCCALAKRGYSREHRPDLLQIEIGLLVDGEGTPIGHEVFDGNVKDVRTVLGTLDRLKEEFGVRRCVFVSDDGMASEANLGEIEQRGYEYITSLSLGKSVIGQELARTCRPHKSWQKVSDNLWLEPLAKQGEVRYIGSYNPERAASTWEHRKARLADCIEYLRSVERERKRRGPKRTVDDRIMAADRFLRRKGCRRLIHLERGEEGALVWKLDRDALRRERRTDGLLILKTNSKTLSDEEVAKGYRMLWRVEDAFRHIKSPIQLRPIRHWSDPRVLGHVFICVLAYTLERLYEQELEKAGLALSARSALDELGQIMVVTLEANGRQLRRRTEISPRQRQLLSAAGVKEVPELW